MISNSQTSHLDSIDSFLAMEIFSRAQQLEAQGREVIHLEFGEPDFSAPESAAESIRKSMEINDAGYTFSQGLEGLRNEIAKKYLRDYGVDILPEQVLVSNGSSLLLYLSVCLLAPPGSEVILTDPAYACYANAIRLAGAKPVFVKLHHEDGFQLNVSELKKQVTKKTKAILINSPMNPTGVVFSEEVMQSLAELDIPVISDEIYADLSFEDQPHSFLSYSPQTVAINGFSKSFAMTGWRLGYMITPEEWMPAADRLHQNLMISATEFVQEAGAAVLQKSTAYCEQMKAEFNRRRLFVLERMSELGMELGYTPTGAFYVLYKYRDSGKSSLDLCHEVLEKTGVAIAPGRDFGSAAEGYIRISYAQSMENIERALTKLAESKLLTS
ncbi:MAG: pyridoxal phosphate-dependent aminotransferase [SAR324 cluster bacterium]|nr:pyridoxal phosphate-dependent aminotransferase [SAR324 cluster bacterium]MBL7035396.1 pyridoxal phosphate-dependent aminotransferase [SAR324 cluster bacterium]